MATRTRPDGIQLQIALVETSDVEYVPGSHRRWDTDEEYRIRLADGQANSRSNAMPGAVRVHQRPGDAVAFEALGLHRGRYHTDKRRRTFMLTYTSDQRAPVRLLLRPALDPILADDGQASRQPRARSSSASPISTGRTCALRSAVSRNPDCLSLVEALYSTPP